MSTNEPESGEQQQIDEDDIQRLQEQFDLESRALESKRALGRVAREYHTPTLDTWYVFISYIVYIWFHGPRNKTETDTKQKQKQTKTN